MNSPKPQSKFMRDAGWVPWLLIGYFLVMMIGIGSLGVIAAQSNPGVVSKNAYKNGLAYNAIIEKADAVRHLGWQAKLHIADTGKAVFVITDKAQNPLTGGTAVLEMMRPATDQQDARLTMAETKQGVYEAQIDHLAKGVWQAYITFQKEGNEFQLHQRLTLP